MRSHHGWRGHLVLAVLAVVVSPGSALPQSRTEGGFRVAPDSPLATDGSTVYAVADDGRTVLAGIGGRDWRVLFKGPTPHRISGLAFGRGALYLSDERAAAVYRLRLSSPGQSPLRDRPAAMPPELIHQGPPLRQPGDLAYTNMVLVADRGAQAVFRIEPDKRAVEALAEGLPPGRLYLAAERGDVVVVSPEAGEIRQPAPFGPYGGAPLSVWRTREQPGGPTGPGASSSPHRRVPLIQSPAAGSLIHGSLYVVDERSGGVFVSFRQQARPARVPPPTTVARPTRLLALEELLLVLDGARGVVHPWPRAVPTQFDLGRRAGPAFDALLSVLLERRALPTRRAAWQGSLEATLSSAAVGTPSPAFKSLVCSLNAAACGGGSWPPGVTGEILVPDVPIEGVIDLETVSAEALGRRTLGEEVDGRVVSSAFADHRQSSEIWELNASALTALAKDSARQTRPWGPFDASRMRELRGTDLPPQFLLTIPVERVRCVLALPRGMLHEEYGLSKIRLLSPGFDWTPLEQIDAKAAGFQPPPPPAPSPSPPPPPCDLAVLKQKHQDLLSAIHFKSPPGIGPVSIGVIEALIDFQHPTFGTATPAFAFLPGWGTPPPVGTGTGAPVCPPGQGPDHGTAVAGLIAGRDSGNGLSGLVPNVQIVPVRPTDADIGGDLFSAFRDRRVLIFNLSAHYEERLPLNIRRKISELQQALFVVAAGNDPTDGKPVCESDRPYPAYPVCEGYRNNVLVVAATNFAGDALIDKVDTPPTPGSNWNERLVHIAAPGIGYYAPGRDNSYVPVRGTSFATPLVTATAALLAAQGVKDPWLIKQRIIATADLRDNLRTKVFGAGLLNVSRAVTAPKHAVLVTTASQEKVVAVEPSDITIRWSTGARTLRLDDVRRLTKSQTGNSYRIVYLDEVTKLLVIQEDVDPGPWPFQYKNVDNAGNPAGNAIADGLHNYKDYVGPLS